MRRAKQKRIAGHQMSMGAPVQEHVAVKAIANEKCLLDNDQWHPYP